LLLVSLASVFPLHGQCAPASLVKVRTAMTQAGLPADSFLARPKTLYRVGNDRGRVEEETNPESGLQLLLVVQEPEIWMCDQKEKRCRHMIDPGPTYNFRAPIVPGATSGFWGDFEFGCELSFLEGAGAEGIPLGPSGRTVYRLEREGARVQLFLGTDGKPQKVEVKTAEADFALQYLEYSTGLEAKEGFFAPPEEFKIEEVE
jgi:hypothetical protein